MLFVSIFALISAIAISSVSAYYSIIGLTTIFPASFLAIAIMGMVLELGKISSAIWLHSFWNKASFLMKCYLTSAVAILMVITSLGIFGFLSKSHIEHTSSITSNSYIIQNLDSQITREEQIIKKSEQVLSQLDESVNTLIEAQRIRGSEGALVVRESQKEERNEVTSQINQSNDKIQSLIEQRTNLEMEQARVEAEVGPIRYVAELVHGPNPDKSVMEEAVRWLIIMIVVVFDPLAITLVLAGISGLKIRKDMKNEKNIPEEKIILPQPIEEIEKTQENKGKIISKRSGWLGEI